MHEGGDLFDLGGTQGERFEGVLGFFGGDFFGMIDDAGDFGEFFAEI